MLYDENLTPNDGYNGWTNYATWRVASEIFDAYYGFHYEGAPNPITADRVKQAIEECVFPEGISIFAGNLKVDYALAFLSNVNCQEIAEDLNKQVSEK